jgi:hypothetical protein
LPQLTLLLLFGGSSLSIRFSYLVLGREALVGVADGAPAVSPGDRSCGTTRFDRRGPGRFSSLTGLHLPCLVRTRVVDDGAHDGEVDGEVHGEVDGAHDGEVDGAQNREAPVLHGAASPCSSHGGWCRGWRQVALHARMALRTAPRARQALALQPWAL